MYFHITTRDPKTMCITQKVYIRFGSHMVGSTHGLVLLKDDPDPYWDLIFLITGRGFSSRLGTMSLQLFWCGKTVKSVGSKIMLFKCI